jgi:hypothetical protein
MLPRLQRYSKQLNDEANFVEIPWAYLDEDGVKVTYLFRRNNELLVTKKGEVATGRWEYLPSMQSLLIEYVGKRRMYNQGFLDKTVLLLRKEGTEELLPLANVELLPDLDIVSYIKNRDRQAKLSTAPKENHDEWMNTKYHTVSLSGGSLINIWKTDNQVGNAFRIGAEVTYANTDTPLDSGAHKIAGGGKLEIRDGKIVKYQESNLGYTIVVIFIILIVTALLAISS